MMATVPIYQGDEILMQLEREQKLREQLERRRKELVEQGKQVERKLDAMDGVKDGDGVSANRDGRSCD